MLSDPPWPCSDTPPGTWSSRRDICAPTTHQLLRGGEGGGGQGADETEHEKLHCGSRTRRKAGAPGGRWVHASRTQCREGSEKRVLPEGPCRPPAQGSLVPCGEEALGGRAGGCLLRAAASLQARLPSRAFCVEGTFHVPTAPRPAAKGAFSRSHVGLNQFSLCS